MIQLKKYLFSCLITIIIPLVIFAQDISYASRVIEYCPAPGQFINSPGTGTPDDANKLAGKIGSPVSLGGYGGYIIFGFNEPVKNNPDNPFGVDFLIAGNAMENIAEQGIVQVMKDENKNGKPDDTWYEIKGSDHFLPGFRKNYRIKYENKGDSADISWTDNIFSSGNIQRNEYHSQPYYPSQEYFPKLDPDSLVFQGSLLPGRVKETEGQIISGHSFFGYADNTPFLGPGDQLIPDNPYTTDIEGCGGDGIDISWAVDEDDNYIEPDEIDFVKIYTGVNRNAGWLGEISTEVAGIIITNPVPGVSGKSGMILPVNIPSSLPSGGEIIPEAIVFYHGKPAEEVNIVWITADENIAVADNNLVIGKNPGTTVLRGTAENDPTLFFEQELRIFQPSRVWIEETILAVREGEARKITCKVFDELNIPVANAVMQADVEDIGVISVNYLTGNDEVMIEGLQEGFSVVDIYPSGYPELAQCLVVHVYKPLPEITCFFSLRTADKAIVPRHKTKITLSDYSAYIDRKPEDYQLTTGFISLASAITEVMTRYGFTSTGDNFRFRADDKSQGELYLWQLADKWEYTYGWGGYAEDVNYAGCWMATVNSEVYTNGFDKIPLNSGDMVTINYVEDISADFHDVIIKETANNDPSGMNSSFLVLYNTYHPDTIDGFTVTSVPLPNEKIQVRSEDGTFVCELFTGGDGVFTTGFESEGVYHLTVDQFPGEVLIVMAGGTGTKFPEQNIMLKAFPNPVEDDFCIFINGTGYYHFILRDVKSKNIMEGMLKAGEDTWLSLGNLSPGVYILTMYSGKEYGNVKILKK